MKRTHAAIALLSAVLVAGSGYVAVAPSAVAQPNTVSALQVRLDQTEGRVTTARQALTAHERALGVRRAQARALATELERAQAVALVALGAGERASAPRAGAVTRARSAWLAAHQGVADLAALVSADRVRLAAALADLAVLRRAAAADRVRRPASAGDGRANPLALRAVDFALAQVGDPYVWAADGPDSWDCSGLTRGAYLSVGVGLPRVSRQQFWAGPLVGGDLLPGDLLFFAYNPADPSTIHHVALYIGSGLMVHAPQPGDVVRIAPIWNSEYAGAVRVLPAVAGGSGHGVPGGGPAGSLPAPGLTPTPGPAPTGAPPAIPSPSPSPVAASPASPSESPSPDPPEDLSDGSVSPVGVQPLFSATP